MNNWSLTNSVNKILLEQEARKTTSILTIHDKKLEEQLVKFFSEERINYSLISIYIKGYSRVVQFIIYWWNINDKSFQVVVEINGEQLRVIINAKSISEVVIKIHNWVRENYKNEKVNINTYRIELNKEIIDGDIILL